MSLRMPINRVLKQMRKSGLHYSTETSKCSFADSVSLSTSQLKEECDVGDGKLSHTFADHAAQLSALYNSGNKRGLGNI